MVKFCKFCNLEYKAKTSRSKYCSKSCKDAHWFILNKEHKRQYYINNIEQIKAREKQYSLIGARAKKNQKWYASSGIAYYANKRKDMNYRLIKNLRTRLWKALNKNWKQGSTVRDLGCTILEFKLYLESKFQQGMTWDNYGKWELDHVMPLSKFDLTDKQQFLTAVHFTNIQPLWRTDNLKKSNKV